MPLQHVFGCLCTLKSRATPSSSPLTSLISLHSIAQACSFFPPPLDHGKYTCLETTMKASWNRRRAEGWALWGDDPFGRKMVRGGVSNLQKNSLINQTHIFYTVRVTLLMRTSSVFLGNIASLSLNDGGICFLQGQHVFCDYRGTVDNMVECPFTFRSCLSYGDFASMPLEPRDHVGFQTGMRMFNYFVEITSGHGRNIKPLARFIYSVQ